MTDITEVHPDYAENKDRWILIKDLLNGQQAVKERREDYLPFPVSLPDEQTETDDFKRQYQIYLEGAQFVEFTSQAVEDLVASIFSRDPIESEALPADLEYLPLADISRELAAKVTSYGRAFLLVDYPEVEGTPTRKEEKEKNINAYMTVFNALDVINWKTQRVGGNVILSQVVISERVMIDNEFVPGYRELLLEAGVYVVNKYDEDGSLLETKTPTATGKPLAYIPGSFVGAMSNTPSIDKSPVIGIANANLKHYQTTAELRHSLTYMGHPMLAITGAPIGFLDLMKEQRERISVGASNALIIEGETGSASILQINSDLAHFKELERLEQSMTEMGYRLKSDKNAVESASALRIRSSGNTSQLAFIATQVESAIERATGYAGDFMGEKVSEDFTYSLVKDYIQEVPDPNIMNAISGLVNMGRIPDWVLFDYLTNVGILDEDSDYDTIRNESEDMTEGGTLPEAGAGDET